MRPRDKSLGSALRNICLEIRHFKTSGNVEYATALDADNIQPVLTISHQDAVFSGILACTTKINSDHLFAISSVIDFLDLR